MKNEKEKERKYITEDEEEEPNEEVDITDPSDPYVTTHNPREVCYKMKLNEPMELRKLKRYVFRFGEPYEINMLKDVEFSQLNDSKKQWAAKCS